MKKIIAFTFLTSALSLNAQLLGIYQFTSTQVCPNESPNVTTSPVNSAFDDFSMQNVFCVATQNVFNTKSWNTTGTINLTEYIQFGIHTVSCDRITVDSLIFSFRNSAAGNTPTWHLRSSVDNYVADIDSGLSMSGPLITDTVLFDVVNFSQLADVKFRIYLTNMGSAGASFRVDNIQLFGAEVFVGTVDYYLDNDGDGFGTGVAFASCTNPGGYSLFDTDCDDTDASLNPNTVFFEDADGDGFGDEFNSQVACVSTLTNPVLDGNDCDDTDPEINPNTIWYIDADGDGFGNSQFFQISCGSSLPGAVLNADDCDDSDPLINPNTVWFDDTDGDGFGDDNVTEIACVSTLTNAVLFGGDCDVTDSAINPATIWYQDNDSDSYGDDAITEVGCSSTLTNPVLIGGDCSDIASDLNPATVWYEDVDGDFYGNSANSQVGCTHSFTLATLTAGDCDDSEATVFQGAPELCDAFDNNCNGSINEGLATTVYYIDNDGDGFGAGSAGDFCDDPGVGYSSTNDDCNDDDFGINPSVVDIPNNTIDEDCDGSDLTNALVENSFGSFKVYPNPGTDNLFISSENLEKGINSISVIDINGKVIFDSKIDFLEESAFEVDASNFMKGAYQIVIYSEKQILRVNWIKI